MDVSGPCYFCGSEKQEAQLSLTEQSASFVLLSHSVMTPLTKICFFFALVRPICYVWDFSKPTWQRMHASLQEIIAPTVVWRVLSEGLLRLSARAI